jgi:hypothetical protein
MSEDRKKPGWAFWATAAVVAGMLYFASFGPACWISSHTGLGARQVATIYGPITACMKPQQHFEGHFGLHSYGPSTSYYPATGDFQ